MDDYNITSLQESNNEWVSRLISVLTPCIVKGTNTIFSEAHQLCVDNDEEDKYLMTFQNFLSRVPKWNTTILEKEVAHIKTDSGCDYLEDLITCVHIIQLKALTCIRVGFEHKSVDLDIPKLDQFVHKIYILLARKIYTNVYLFEKNIPPLDIQRNNREFEVIIRECIMEAIRESIPVEKILRSYLDETVEENVETVITTLQENTNTSESTAAIPQGEIKKEMLGEVESSASNDVVMVAPITESLSQVNSASDRKSLTFSNIDEAQSTDNTVINLHAPKDIKTLEQKSDENHARRLLEEDEGEDDEEVLKISKENVNIELEVETL